MTNRQVYEEAAVIFYGCNKFSFDATMDWVTLAAFLATLRSPSLRALSAITVLMLPPLIWRPGSGGGRGLNVEGNPATGVFFGEMVAYSLGTDPWKNKDEWVDTLPSSAEYCFKLLGKEGSPLRLELICNGWSLIPSLFPGYATPPVPLWGRYLAVAQNLEELRRQYTVPAADAQGRVDMIFRGKCWANRFPPKGAVIEQECEILPSDPDQIQRARELSNGNHTYFTMRWKPDNPRITPEAIENSS